MLSPHVISLLMKFFSTIIFERSSLVQNNFIARKYTIFIFWQVYALTLLSNSLKELVRSLKAILNEHPSKNIFFHLISPLRTKQKDNPSCGTIKALMKRIYFIQYVDNLINTDIFFLNYLHNEDTYSSNFGKFWPLTVFGFAYVFPYY